MRTRCFRSFCRLWGLLAVCAAFVMWTGGAPPAAGQSRAPQPDARTDTLESGSRKAQQLFVRGLTRAQVDDYAAAIAAYEKALEHAPDAAAILSALADAHNQQGDRSSALFYARRALDLAPATPSYALQLAALHRDAGETQEAIDVYTRLLERRPQHPGALRALAEAHAEAGATGEAIDAYERWRRAAPTPSEDGLTALLALYRQMGDAAGVEQTLRTLVDRAPQDLSYRRQLAQWYADQDRPQDAIAVYESLLCRSPRDTESRSALASLYRAQGQPARADALEQRARPAPASPDALLNRARQLTASSPDSTARAEAIDLIQQVLDQAPKSEAALTLLSRLQMQAGRYAEAGATLERLLAENPRSPARWAQAAAAYLRAGQPSQAQSVADEGLILFPGQPPLLRTSALALAETDRFDRALQQAEQAAASDTSAATLHALGWVQFQRGNVRSARQTLQRAVEQQPSDAVIYEHLGDVYDALGNADAARRWWTEALKRDSTRQSVRTKLNAPPK